MNVRLRAAQRAGAMPKGPSRVMMCAYTAPREESYGSGRLRASPGPAAQARRGGAAREPAPGKARDAAADAAPAGDGPSAADAVAVRGLAQRALRRGPGDPGRPHR